MFYKFFPRHATVHGKYETITLISQVEIFAIKRVSIFCLSQQKIQFLALSRLSTARVFPRYTNRSQTIKCETSTFVPEESPPLPSPPVRGWKIVGKSQSLVSQSVSKSVSQTHNRSVDESIETRSSNAGFFETLGS